MVWNPEGNGFQGKLKLLVTVELERDSHTDTACLCLVQAIQYSELSASPESILHPEEYEYFISLSALKRKKDFLLGRFAAKRALLCLLPGVSPAAIQIKSGVFQQPIVSGQGYEGFAICITHSADYAAAVAFPGGHPLGIDIEWHDPGHLEALKDQISPHELPPINHSSAEVERYSRVWTIKESLSKILRCGLMTPFSVFELNADPDPVNDVWVGGFQNFHQYRFLSLSNKNMSFALVHPGRTKVSFPKQKVISFFEG